MLVLPWDEPTRGKLHGVWGAVGSLGYPSDLFARPLHHSLCPIGKVDCAIEDVLRGGGNDVFKFLMTKCQSHIR